MNVREVISRSVHFNSIGIFLFYTYAWRVNPIYILTLNVRWFHGWLVGEENEIMIQMRLGTIFHFLTDSFCSLAYPLIIKDRYTGPGLTIIQKI